MGFETVAITRGHDKEPLARQLGAHHYIDATAHDVVTELQKLGGARVILATAPNAQAISALVDGLAASGTLVVPAAPAEPLTLNVLSLISGRRAVAGWYSGTARDAQDTLAFSALTGVHPMIETYPLHRVADAYEHMLSGRSPRRQTPAGPPLRRAAAARLTPWRGTPRGGARVCRIDRWLPVSPLRQHKQQQKPCRGRRRPRLRQTPGRPRPARPTPARERNCTTPG